MRIVHGVVLVPFVGAHRKLVDPRFANLAENLTGVEAGFQELLREVLEQLRIGGGISRADVVQRLDDPAPQQIPPDPVHVARGEVTVVRCGHPDGELLTAGFLRLFLDGCAIGKLRFGHLAGAVVLHLAGGIFLHHFKQRLGALHRGATELAAVARGIFRQRELREVCRSLVVLILRPAFERMVVALVAVETSREEKVRRVFHRLRGLAQNFPVTRGRVVLVGAVRGDDLAHELVVGHVFIHGIADPRAETFRAFLAEELRVDLEKIAPLVGPVLDEIHAADELIDDRLALHL